jgi:DNA (cytosine-5)-methyltransferase 1
MRPPRRQESGATFISLFSGCGGFDIGFLEAGYKCLGACDIDENVVATHRLNLNSPAYCCDLSSGTLAVPHAQQPDVVLAGSPCQGFSTAGKRQIDDPRNHLLVAAAKIGVQLKPTVFIAENVAGVTAGAHKRYWEEADSILRNAGYQTVTVTIQATDLGMGQLRRRVVLIAWNVDRQPILAFETRRAKTLQEVLSNLPVDAKEFAITLSEGSIPAVIAARIGPGQKLSNVRGGPRAVPTWEIPTVYGRTSEQDKAVLRLVQRLRRQHRVRKTGDADPVSLSTLSTYFGTDITNRIRSLVDRGYLRDVDDRIDLTNTFNGKFRRLAWNAPSLTVDTRFGDPRYFLHPDENRGFSVREAARIQGFADHFQFLGTPRQRFRMIGNAVPPPISRELAFMVSPIFTGQPR